MSGATSMSERPSGGDDLERWKAYWTARGMPWRREAEISAERQQYLDARRAVTQDINRGIYPFLDAHGGVKLTRADIEWLLATHKSGGMRGPVIWTDKKQRGRAGLNLCGAHLEGTDLSRLPLAGLHGSLTWSEQPEGAGDGVDAAAIHLEGASLRGALLESAELRAGRMAGADLRECILTGANLYGADLSGARLGHAVLMDTNMRRVIFTPSSNLYGVTLANAEFGAPRLRDVQWNGVDVTVMEWGQVRRLGDETTLRQRRRAMNSTDLPNATRANRQLATVLRGQGLYEHADRFAYRAQLLQRRVFRKQHKYLRYLGSLVLDLISGYGYKPLRSFFAYLIVILGFAGAYLILGGANHQILTWNEALVISMIAFHGRGFFQTTFQVGDPQAAVAAVEALFGLLIEITFIATFTQRFFGSK